MTETIELAPISTYSVIDGVAVFAINSPPVNALGYDVRVALDEGISRGIGDAEAQALIIRCDG
ncbi:MAG: enoyl-CoA hydratase, partial [Sphingobium sp.]